jgi:predicted membrane protein
MPPPVLTADLHTSAPTARQPRTKPMPLLAAAFCVPVLATALAVPTVAIVLEQPSAADAYAIIGAILASIITLMEARYKARPLLPSIANFLGSAAAGSFFPAIAYYVCMQWGWIHPDTSHWAKTWQAWAAAGFLSGLNGWLIINRTSAVLKSFDGLTKGNR